MGRTTFSGPVVSENGFEGAFTATSVQLESNNGNKITLDAPNSLAASYTLLFPGNDGDNGQVLTTNGSGVTSWTTNGTGTVSNVATSGTVNGLTLTGGPITSTGTITLGGTLSLATAPAIGSTSANTGAFTTLNASSNVTFTGIVVSMANLPTSDPVVAGQLWNDTGTLKVSAG